MSNQIGAASFGLIVGLSKFRSQLQEGERTAEESAERMGRSLGDGVDRHAAPGLQRAGESMIGFGQKASALGARLTLLTAPLAAIGFAGARMAAEFDESMTKMQSLVGLSADEVERFGAEIGRVSSETGVGSRELADAMFYLTSAGLRGQTAVDALSASARASAVGLGETKVIADLVTGAMNAYGHENLNAGRAVDILTAAVREGKMEASDMAANMGSLIPTAAALGIQFDQVAGVMAAMSRTNSNASENATQLNAVLTLLSRAAGPQAEEMLSSVGLSMRDLRTMAAGPGGLVEVMRTLDGAFAGNDEALSTLIPNVRAFRGFMSLLAQDGDAVDSVLAGVADSAGDADKAFGVFATSNSAKMRQARNDIDNSIQTIGEILLPTLAMAAGAVAGLVGAFQALPEPMQTGVVMALAFVTVLGPLVLIAGKLVSTVGLVIVGVTKLIGIVKALGVTAMLSNPWVLAIVAALAGVALVIYHWETIKEWFRKFFDWFTGAATKTIEWFKRNWPTIAAIMTGPFGIATLAIVKNWDTIKNGATAAIKWITDRFTGLVSTIRNMPRQIAQAARGMWDGILEAFKSMLRWIVDLWNGLGFTLPTWTVPGWLGGGQVGGQRIEVPQMRIPGLANGGTVLSAGMTLVGERGPELLQLPTGARVAPLDHASGHLGAGATAFTINNELRIDRDVIARVVTDVMADRERITGRPAFGRSGGRRI